VKSLEKAKAIERLQKALVGISELQNQPRDTPAFKKWHMDTLIAITHIFGEKSPNLNYFLDIRLELRTSAEHVPLYQSVLQSMIEEVQEYGVEQIVPGSPAARIIKANARDVFIIFGHDRANALELQKMLKTTWNLDAVMLEDYAGKSRTLIKKFEDVADTVKYAFALMTADDTVQKTGEDYDQARPNVLFELGWFCCRLTRSGVCLLFQKNTKIPSDLEGIERLEFDKSVKEQHGNIEKELKEAGVI
jgi:predicted nucleotide-binding protein